MVVICLSVAILSFGLKGVYNNNGNSRRRRENRHGAKLRTNINAVWI